MADKKGSALTVLVLVVLLVAGLAANYLQWGNFQEANARLAEEELLLLVAQTRLNSLKELEKKVPQMEADLEVLGALLPAGPQEDKFLLDLQSGSDLSDMKFMQIRFGERVVGDGFVEMPVSAQFEGTYHELLYFLDYLQVYERAVRIDELRVDEAEDGMMVSVQASAFYAAE
jgi:Tfp pilus assembly protein PilO